MGKLGGRSRQWLLEGLSNDYKPIPEYGLRIILAFSPRTSFLVPLDRCVQFGAAAIKQGRSLAACISRTPEPSVATSLRSQWGAFIHFLPRPTCAAPSPHQQQNAVRLVHVCLSTLMKAGLPKPAAMESSLVFTALQECLLQGELRWGLHCRCWTLPPQADFVANALPALVVVCRGCSAN